MDWFLIITGLTIVAGAILGVWKPHETIGSVTGWRKRLEELNAGAPEAYFEEKRQLEAYPPRESSTPQRIRFMAWIGVLIGMGVIVIGVLE